MAVLAPPAPSALTSVTRRGDRRLAAVPTVAAGVGLAIIVGRDGSPVWQLVRLVAVGVVFGAASVGVVQRRPLVRIGAAGGLSLVAVPIGIGFGLPHLAKTGLSLETVAGLLVPAPISREAEKDVTEGLAALPSPPFFYVENPTNMSPARSASDAPRVGVTFNGTRRDVLIQDVIAVHGPRNAVDKVVKGCRLHP